MSRVHIIGTPSAERVIQKSCTFNGTDEYMSLTSSITGDVTNQSLSFWVKPTNTSSGVIFECYGTAAPADNFFRVTHSNQDITIALESNNVALYTASTTGDVVPSGSWTHVVLAQSGALGSADSKVFINGVKQTLSAATTRDGWTIGAITGVAKFRFGANQSAASFFAGSLAEIILGSVTGSNPDVTVNQYGISGSGTWKPKPFPKGSVLSGAGTAYTVNYDNHGFHLRFLDSASMGKDFSGIGHNFTLTNMDASNQSTSVP